MRIALLGTPLSVRDEIPASVRGCTLEWVSGDGNEALWQRYDAVFVFCKGDTQAVTAETVRGWIGHPHLRVIGGLSAEGERNALLREVDALVGGEERERKLLIRYPDTEQLSQSPFCAFSHIVQTYLLSESGVTERVRARESGGETVYTHTLKRRINCDTSEEREEQIGRERYEALLCRADLTRKPIEKTRGCVLHAGRYFELDLYPFWEDRAILELELSGKEHGEIVLPPFFELIRDVTDDVRYKNARLAAEVPVEEI